MNSLENFPRISCIRLKFSREFVVSTANIRRDTANSVSKCCQSCQSQKRLSTDCNPFVHRAFVSLTVLNTFFLRFKRTI